MDFRQILCVFLCAIYLLHFVELKVTNYFIEKPWFPKYNSTIRKIKQDDVVIYKGFGHNPFGPSTRYITSENNSLNLTFPNSIRIPIVSSVSPDLMENSVDDTGQSTHYEGRSKRGVLHLYNMVKCATGCDPLSYKGYGCYCGFLGSGQPVDPIDSLCAEEATIGGETSALDCICCKKHDWCYVNAGCPYFFEYIVPYYWKCYRNKPVCAVEHGEWGGRNSCARRLCECDRILSECLRRYPCPKSRAFCHSSPWRLLQNAFMLLK